MNDKERLARDLAETLAETQDTDVTPESIASWKYWDVYDWLEAWDFEWNGRTWELVEEA